MENFLYQATIYLAAAVVAVSLSARLGTGSVLGYLFAGILIGPTLGLVGAETATLQHVAEFGIVMMLFLIGLEFDPRALWAMRNRFLGVGGLQIVLTTLALMGVALTAGWPWQTALAVGLSLSLSSTAIVLQTLSEKGLIQTGGGRSAFSVLLAQDIAVVPILAILPLLAIPPGPRLGPDGAIQRAIDTAHDVGHDSMSLVEGLPAWGVTLVTIAAVGFVILGGIYLAHPLFRFVHATRLREMHAALALVIVTGISLLMTVVGLSPALGAFLAGVVLANSEFRHELQSHLEPFKGLFLGLFFITVGAGVNVQAFLRNPGDLIGLALLLILLKGLILHAVGRAFRLRGRDKWLFTLSLAQAGEFGFVLLAFAVQQHVIPSGLSERLLIIIALSMLITPLMFIVHDLIVRRITERSHGDIADEIDEQAPIIIAGIGRFGQTVNRLVRASGFPTIVLDSNLETIQLMRKFGVKGFLGDPTRPELLRAAGLDKAEVLVAALDAPDQVTRLVTYARSQRPDLHIIARAHDRQHVFQLYRVGANDIVRETFDSALRCGRYVLENVGLSEYEAAQAEEAFYSHDRHTVHELAQVWDPARPPKDNPAYIARVKELERDLEAALMARLEEGRKPGS